MRATHKIPPQVLIHEALWRNLIQSELREHMLNLHHISSDEIGGVALKPNVQEDVRVDGHTLNTVESEAHANPSDINPELRALARWVHHWV